MNKRCLVYFVYVFGLNLDSARAGFFDDDDDDFHKRFNNAFKDHDDFFDSIGTLIGVIFGSICFLIFVGCLCCCLCPFCFLHKSRREGRVLRQQGQGIYLSSTETNNTWRQPHGRITQYGTIRQITCNVSSSLGKKRTNQGSKDPNKDHGAVSRVVHREEAN